MLLLSWSWALSLDLLVLRSSVFAASPGVRLTSLCAAIPRLLPVMLFHTRFLPISRVYFTVECHVLSPACSKLLVILVLPSAPQAKLMYSLRPMETMERTVAVRHIV